MTHLLLGVTLLPNTGDIVIFFNDSFSVEDISHGIFFKLIIKFSFESPFLLFLVLLLSRGVVNVLALF